MPGYAHGQITEDFIKANADGINKMFYLYGPPPMMEAMLKQHTGLNVNKNSIII